jgi:hypothetical protein
VQVPVAHQARGDQTESNTKGDVDSEADQALGEVLEWRQRIDAVWFRARRFASRVGGVFT